MTAIDYDVQNRASETVIERLLRYLPVSCGEDFVFRLPGSFKPIHKTEMSKRQRIHFFGNVQGVGFRYTACSVARGFNVTGYVRNRRDGSVELVVEGKSKEIERFLDSLDDRMGGHIDRKEPATGQFDKFEIR